jgi:hypothetical protein
LVFKHVDHLENQRQLFALDSIDAVVDLFKRYLVPGENAQQVTGHILVATGCEHDWYFGHGDQLHNLRVKVGFVPKDHIHILK